MISDRAVRNIMHSETWIKQDCYRFSVYNVRSKVNFDQLMMNLKHHQKSRYAVVA